MLYKSMNYEIESLKNLMTIIKDVDNLNISDDCKYLLNPKAHIDRCKRALNLIRPTPTSKVLDIGCGNGYLLYLCRELYECEITGLDLPEYINFINDKDFTKQHQIYRELTERFNINVIKHHIKPLQAMPLVEKYDIITATMTVFNKYWSVAQHDFWVRDCKNHLSDNGKIFLLVNNNTLMPASKSFFKPYKIEHETNRIYIIPAHRSPIQKDHSDHCEHPDQDQDVPSQESQ